MAATPIRSLTLALVLLSLSVMHGQAGAADPAPAVAGSIAATAVAPANVPAEDKGTAVKGTAVQSAAADAPPASGLSVLSARAASIVARLGDYTQGAQEIVKGGFAYLGVDYKRGGTSPETGFDCSGLVRRVFDDAFGVDLPHNARAISKEGAKVSVRDLRPGDLVFFNTLRKTFSHVGIYVGNHMFVHAPSSGGGVRIEDMRERYWVRHFNGARRISIE